MPETDQQTWADWRSTMLAEHALTCIRDQMMHDCANFRQRSQR
jgi:hypothetical protein